MSMVTIECQPTSTREYVFIEDNYAAIAVWESDYCWGSLQLYKIETMQDLMEQHIRFIAKRSTPCGYIQDRTVSVNGITCYLKTSYDVRLQRTHFYLKSSCGQYEATYVANDKDMA